jgi:hypothetical protein
MAERKKRHKGKRYIYGNGEKRHKGERDIKDRETWQRKKR